MTTELTLPQRAAVALNSKEHEKRLAELAERSKSIVAITNADGRQECHAARMALKNTRVEIQKVGKAAREDAVKFSKAIIAEEDRLVGIISPEEQRLEGIQQAWDDAIEAARQAEIKKEQDRVEGIQVRIREFAGCVDMVRRYPNMKAAEIKQHIEDLQKVQTDGTFMEFYSQAEIAKSEALAALQQYRDAAEAREVEEARLAAEAARLKAEREADEARRQTQAAQEAEERRVRDEADRKAREALAQQQRALEAQEADLRRQREELERAKPVPPPPAPDPEPLDMRDPDKLEESKPAAAQEKPMPTAEEIGMLVAERYNLSHWEAMQWISKLFDLSQVPF